VSSLPCDLNLKTGGGVGNRGRKDGMHLREGNTAPKKRGKKPGDKQIDGDQIRGRCPVGRLLKGFRMRKQTTLGKEGQSAMLPMLRG